MKQQVVFFCFCGQLKQKREDGVKRKRKKNGKKKRKDKRKEGKKRKK